jgi:hypothetical protein
VAQIGLVALALILGRAIQPEEFPTRLGDVLAAATEYAGPSGRLPLSAPLRAWLLRVLQLDARWSFGSVSEAGRALDRLMAQNGQRPSPGAIEAFLHRYQGQAVTSAPAGATRFVSIPRGSLAASGQDLAATGRAADTPAPSRLRKFFKH